jgi:hypothetical protein
MQGFHRSIRKPILPGDPETVCCLVMAGLISRASCPDLTLDKLPEGERPIAEPWLWLSKSLTMAFRQPTQQKSRGSAGRGLERASRPCHERIVMHCSLPQAMANQPIFTMFAGKAKSNNDNQPRTALQLCSSSLASCSFDVSVRC